MRNAFDRQRVSIPPYTAFKGAGAVVAVALLLIACASPTPLAGLPGDERLLVRDSRVVQVSVASTGAGAVYGSRFTQFQETPTAAPRDRTGAAFNEKDQLELQRMLTRKLIRGGAASEVSSKAAERADVRVELNLLSSELDADRAVFHVAVELRLKAADRTATAIKEFSSSENEVMRSRASATIGLARVKVLKEVAEWTVPQVEAFLSAMPE